MVYKLKDASENGKENYEDSWNVKLRNERKF